MDDFVSLDDWKPAEKKKCFRVPSQWRKECSYKTTECLPDLDELQKIKAHIKAGVSKEEIMKIFNISSLTYKKIKLGKYKMYDEIYYPPTKELKEEIFNHISRLHQDIKEDVMIEYNITSPMFEAIFKELSKPKKKAKLNDSKSEVTNATN